MPLPLPPVTDDEQTRMKLRLVLKSKIHKAIVTMTDLHYEGSIGID